MNYEELLLRAGVILAATFFGALIAYQLQNTREKITAEKEQINSLNIALFTLLRQVNALAVFKKDLDALRNDKSRFFKLQPWQTSSYDDVKFDFKSLSFTLSTKDPNILHNLLIEQERFEQTLNAIKIRSEYQVKTIQPLLEDTNIGNKKLPFNEVENIIGKYKLEGIILGTNNVYEHVDKTFLSSKKMLEELHAFAKICYPKVGFIKIDENA